MANKAITSFIGCCLLLLVTSQAVFAQSVKYTLEAPSADPTLVVRGDEVPITDLNKMGEGKDAVFMYSGSQLNQLASAKVKFSGVVVNNQLIVQAVIDKAADFQAESLAESSFVVGVQVDSKHESFFLTKLKKGDLVKLRKDGEITDLSVLIASGSKSLNLATATYSTVNKPTLKIDGRIDGFQTKEKLVLKIDGKVVGGNLQKADFAFNKKLVPGVNYVKVELWSGTDKLDEKTLISFYKDKQEQQKRLVLWVEQFPNAKVLTNAASIDSMLIHAKAAGFNTVAFDVKGPEGYASYRKNNLSHTPYYTATINPNKKVEETGFDLLQALIYGVRKHGLEIYVSFNFFTEGNVSTQDYAVLKQHPDWEEIVQRPEDKGALLKISESAVGAEAKQGKRIALAFVNPSNKEVQDFQLLRVREVVENYDIDGIVLDRTRYDNLYADFSPLTKTAFEAYLKVEGKSLHTFPDDVYRIDETGKLIEGALYTDWITFRSQTIKDFVARLRTMIDATNRDSGKSVKMAAYVGSWYEAYYQNGVNWASANFKYKDELKFPAAHIYTARYAQTSYLQYLDFLMIGTYYKTDREISKYVTLGNILTNGELPLVASISLPDLKEDDRPGVFKSAVTNSSGIMIFDLCYIKWHDFTEQFKNNTK